MKTLRHRIVLLCATVLVLSACNGGRLPVAGMRAELSENIPGSSVVHRSSGVVIDQQLLELLDSAGDDDELDVIVTFGGNGAPPAEAIAELNRRGLRGLHLRYLPIAGVRARPAQIFDLMDMPGVRSLWHNAPVQLEDEAANYMTSVTQARKAPQLTNADGEPITGKGVTILVNDSGIDGTHLDLLFGDKVLANALGHTNLNSTTSVAPFTPVEDVPNTDVLGSHGSHVAGIAAGLGTLSDGLYVGAAPGATLAGYGSGATLLVLDTLGGFDYAMQLRETRPELNLRIVTNSFGSTSDQGTRFNPDHPTNVVTKILADNGLVVVFSAGNSGSGPDSITGNYKKAPWVLVAANGTKNGMLATSSSRGALADGVYSVSVDGEAFTVEDRPLVVTPGTDYISVRATAAEPFTPLDLVADSESGDIAPEHLPFYTHKSGTSMAAPHLAGLTALLLEANPDLTWREIKQIFKTTATNMPGYDAWEVGAGYANVEAALAMALDLRRDYGATNHVIEPFRAFVPITDVESFDTTLDFLPAGEIAAQEFEVGPDTAVIIATWDRPNTTTCTCGVTLESPDGKRYGSGIGLPLLAPRVAAAAPGKVGTWKVYMRGIGSVSGVDVDPADVTNGVSAPASADVSVDQYLAGTPVGIDDTFGRADEGLLKTAIQERLLDARGAGFAPDAALTRGEFARALMAWGVRQTRDHNGSFPAVAADPATAHALEATSRTGQLILTQDPESRALIESVDRTPDALVTREQAAYALIQAMGRQAQAEAYSGELMAADADGNATPVADGDEVDESRRGHVQDALALGILAAEFVDGQAFVNPQRPVSRAEYAAMAVRAFAVTPFP